MKSLMGTSSGSRNEVQGLASKYTNGDMDSVTDTEVVLENVKVNKPTGSDNIPPWVLEDFSHLLAASVTNILNSSLSGSQQLSFRCQRYIHQT